jgi:two-component system, response regulator
MGGEIVGETKTRILIIEDNSDDEALLMRQLEKAGLAAKVQVIANGSHALRFLFSDEHELVAVFLDLKLPEISGLEILKKVRAHERLSALPVIVMTSSNHPEEIEHCHRLGVAGFVQKPVTFSSFSKAIADTFHRPHHSSGPLSRTHE